MLKHKYGLSMQAWIYRARDLGVLTDAGAVALFKKFNKLGWRDKEPGEAFCARGSKQIREIGHGSPG